MIPELIGLLTDADGKVGESAHQALRRLTGEDFGPPAGCPQKSAKPPPPSGRRGMGRMGCDVVEQFNITTL